MKKLTSVAVVAAAGLAVAAAAVAATVVVSPGHMNGWLAAHDSCGSTSTNTGSQGFAQGPAKPPAGHGSYRLSVGSNGTSNETIRSHVIDGRRLTDLTALRYWSYEGRFGSDARAVYLRLAVDRTGNGTTDDILMFQPADQASVKLNTWQSWDAVQGGWRSERTPTPSGRLVTLSQYQSLYPNSRVATDNGGGLRIGAGCGGAAWSNFTGYVDAVTVGAGGNGTNPVTPTANPTTPGVGKAPPAPTVSTLFDFEPAANLTNPGKSHRPGQGGGSPQQTPGNQPQSPAANHKVAMCHNGHTIQVDRHAVPAHRSQGDTMGACGHDETDNTGNKDEGDHD